jgi:hypothetical protein
VIPAGAAAFGFVAALDPVGVVDDLAADAFLLLFVVVLGLGFDLLLDAFGLLPGLLSLAVLVDVLLLEVVEDVALEVEGVEEGSLGEGGDVFGVDRSDLEGVLFLGDDLCVFWNL